MHWITLNIPGNGVQAVAELRDLALSLAKTSPQRREFQDLRLQTARHPDTSVRACGLLLTDFVEHGRLLRVRSGQIQFSADSGITTEENGSRENIRRRLHVARGHQLRAKATREFISAMEQRRLYKDSWVSIFSLMRDGPELEQRLRKLRDGKSKLEEAFSPYIQLVQAEERCAFTGFHLMSIWRYFRHTWANPYNSVPGRSLMLLVRDAAADNHPIIGIAALASSAVQLAIRDEWIGWTPESIVSRLRTDAKNADIAWLASLIDRGVKEIYTDDLLNPKLGPLTSRDLGFPGPDALKWLRKYSRDQREIHHKNSNSREYKSHAMARSGNEAFWRIRAESALFRSKRAETLAVLLRAKSVLYQQRSKVVGAAEFRTRLQSADSRQAIQSLIRKIKSEYVGIALADISVCGAVPPYSPLTAGKLIAMLLTSPELILAYDRRYANAESVIASSIAGRPIVRRPSLVLLGTTSLYGSEPNQYTRLQIPCEAVGGPTGHSVRFQLLGKTEGYGTFQFSDDTVEALGDAVAQFRGGKRVNSIFGEGVNPRLRKIRDGLELLGLDSDHFLMHGNPRLVYAVPLALNFREYLLGRAAKAKYPFSLKDPASTTKALVNWWAQRWLLRRIQRDDVLAQVGHERLTYPIRHRARVRIPDDDENERFTFARENSSASPEFAEGGA
jgi:hypothetical protein